MKKKQNVLFDDYNQLESPDKQGEDGDAGGFVPYEYPGAPVGLRQDTRRDCETARSPHAPVYMENPKFESAMNMPERSCDAS
jgi:hypothetical protein